MLQSAQFIQEILLSAQHLIKIQINNVQKQQISVKPRLVQTLLLIQVPLHARLIFQHAHLMELLALLQLLAQHIL